MPLLHWLVRSARLPIATTAVTELVRTGKVVVSPETCRAIPEEVWTAALERYFRGDWPALSDTDLARLPDYTRRGLHLMAAFGGDTQRFHILADRGQRATWVRMGWE